MVASTRLSSSVCFREIQPQVYPASPMNASHPSQVLTQTVAQILLQESDPSTKLNAIAQIVAEYSQADACLVLSQRLDHSLTCQGFWVSDPSLTDVVLAPLSSLLMIHPHHPTPTQQWITNLEAFSGCIRLLTPQEGVVILGYRQASLESPLSPEELQHIQTGVAIALSHIQLQQQVAIGQQYQNLLNPLTHALHRSSDWEVSVTSALAELAQTLVIDRSFAVMLKSNNPLYKTRHQQKVPQNAKATLVGQWNSANLPALEIRESFWLTDSLICAEAWQQFPQPYGVSQVPLPLHSQSSEIDQTLFPLDQVRSWLIIPLTGVKNKSKSSVLLLGFLVLQSVQPRVWQLHELDLATWVCTQLSTSMLHNITLQKVQLLVKDRTEQLERSLDVQAKLYEKTRQQLTQLRELIELKDEFLDAVSHELKTPLTTMKVAIQMLRQRELPPTLHTKYLDVLDQEWQREYNLVHDLLALQRLESNQHEVHIQRLSLSDILNPLHQNFQETWAKKGIQTKITYTTHPHIEDETPHPILLYSDLESLQRILAELLTNAGKYSHAGTTVKIKICQEIRQDGDRIIITITNFGDGIPLEEQPKIFDKFTRGKGMTENAVAGTGLGLALVKGLVSHLNGTIEVKSCVTEGDQLGETCFTLTLPQFPETP